MRFKPRNELERIADVINLLGENKNKKKIKNLLDQLKKIDIDKFRKTKDFTKLKQLYKKNPLYLEENKKDRNEDDNKKNESKSKSSSDDDELDYQLETNLHRKIRNINLELEKENKKKNKLLKDRGDNNESSLDKKIKEKNKKLLELFKDDEKLYFKGASQYVQNRNQNYLLNKNTIIRSMSAMNNFPNSRNNLYSPKSYNSNINININSFNSCNSSSPRDKPNNITFFQKINTNNSNRKTRPVSMLISFNKKRNKTIDNFGRNDLIKKVDIKYQIKKRNMDKIIDKEINNSILKDFYGKLSQKEYSQVFEKPLYLEKNIDKINIGKVNIDMDLDEKLNYLKKITEIKFMNNGKRFWSINNFKNEVNSNELRKSICVPKTNKDKKEKNKVNHNDDEVIIDGIKYKNYDIKNISDVIFTKCGYYHKKII
jgi:hypothetical protein